MKRAYDIIMVTLGTAVFLVFVAAVVIWGAK